MVHSPKSMTKSDISQASTNQRLSKTKHPVRPDMLTNVDISQRIAWFWEYGRRWSSADRVEVKNLMDLNILLGLKCREMLRSVLVRTGHENLRKPKIGTGHHDTGRSVRLGMTLDPR